MSSLKGTRLPHTRGPDLRILKSADSPLQRVVSINDTGLRISTPQRSKAGDPNRIRGPDNPRPEELHNRLPPRRPQGFDLHNSRRMDDPHSNRGPRDLNKRPDGPPRGPEMLMRRPEDPHRHPGDPSMRASYPHRQPGPGNPSRRSLDAHSNPDSMHPDRSYQYRPHQAAHPLQEPAMQHGLLPAHPGRKDETMGPGRPRGPGDERQHPSHRGPPDGMMRQPPPGDHPNDRSRPPMDRGNPRPPDDRRHPPGPDDRRHPLDGRRHPSGPDDRRHPLDDRRHPSDDGRHPSNDRMSHGPPDDRLRPPRSALGDRLQPTPGAGLPLHPSRRPPGHNDLPNDRRYPPSDDRRGPPPSDDRRGPPPSDDRRGPPPGGRRGPIVGFPEGPSRSLHNGPPDDRHGPADGRPGPPSGYPHDRPVRLGDNMQHNRSDDRRLQHSMGGRPEDRHGPQDERRLPPPPAFADDRRAGPPRPTHDSPHEPPPGMRSRHSLSGGLHESRRVPPPVGFPGDRPPFEGFSNERRHNLMGDRRGPPPEEQRQTKRSRLDEGGYMGREGAPHGGPPRGGPPRGGPPRGEGPPMSRMLMAPPRSNGKAHEDKRNYRETKHPEPYSRPPLRADKTYPNRR